MSPVVLLHDEQSRSWLRFSEPVEVFSTSNASDVPYYLRKIESLVAYRNVWAVGYLSYDAAPAFDKSMRVHQPVVESDSNIPLLWFGIFHAPAVVDSPLHVREADSDKPAQYSRGEWTSEIARQEYLNAIQKIKEHIREGDTYQVNFTYRQRAAFAGNTAAFFADLLSNQPGGYGCMIDTDTFCVASVSPELFLHIDGPSITTRPMKGTAPRGYTTRLDSENVDGLQRSEKNRAENLMIVDMMRNDLNRIARPGSVKVPNLFSIERYPTVLQMTSTVQAETDCSWSEIIAALFPCSSITGAPKIRTMDIIAELEVSARGIYTGTIGYLAPGRKSQMNVAIRTVLIDKVAGEASYGIGGGIVWDSDPADEYEESRVKAKVLVDNCLRDTPTHLLETMRLDPGAGIRRLERHLSRLASSAEYFGIKPNLDEVRTQLNELQIRYADQQSLLGADDLEETKTVGQNKGEPRNQVGASALRVRLVVGNGEDISLTTTVIPASERDIDLSVKLADKPVDKSDVTLYHKTTSRLIYDEALDSADGFDDVLLYNHEGQLTEFALGNVVLQIGDSFLTPPVASGLLSGTMRAELLEKDEIIEQTVYLKDLDGATVFRINSVRGWQRVQLSAGDIKRTTSMYPARK